MRNSVPPPSYVKAAGFKGRVDRWQEFEWVAPSSVLQWTGAADVGTGAYEGKREGGFQFRLFHGLTPETETSCFYFWSCANGYRQNEPEATEQLYREIAPTFVEDKDMVEAQQARLTELGEQGLVNIVSDTNRVIMRRFIERLIGAGKGSAGGGVDLSSSRLASRQMIRSCPVGSPSLDCEMYHGDAAGRVVGHVTGNRLTFLGGQRAPRSRTRLRRCRNRAPCPAPGASPRTNSGLP